MNKKFEEALDVIEKELLNLNDEGFQKILNKYKNGIYSKLYKKYSEIFDTDILRKENLGNVTNDTESSFKSLIDTVNNMSNALYDINDLGYIKSVSENYNLMFNSFLNKLNKMNKNIQQWIIKRLEKSLKNKELL